MSPVGQDVDHGAEKLPLISLPMPCITPISWPTPSLVDFIQDSSAQPPGMVRFFKIIQPRGRGNVGQPKGSALRCLPPSSFSCATLRLPCVCGGPAAARRGRIKAAPHPIHIPFPGNKPHSSTQAGRTLPFSFTCYFCKPNRGIDVEEIEQTRNTASRLRKRV